MALKNKGSNIIAAGDGLSTPSRHFSTVSIVRRITEYYSGFITYAFQGHENEDMRMLRMLGKEGIELLIHYRDNHLTITLCLTQIQPQDI